MIWLFIILFFIFCYYSMACLQYYTLWCFLKRLFSVLISFCMVALVVQFYFKQCPGRDTLSFWLYGFPPVHLQYCTYFRGSWRGYIQLFSYLNLSVHFFMYIFYLYGFSPFCLQCWSYFCVLGRVLARWSPILGFFFLCFLLDFPLNLWWLLSLFISVLVGFPAQFLAVIYTVD